VPEREAVAAHLQQIIKPGDLVITLGAGNIQFTCDELLSLLRPDRAPSLDPSPRRGEGGGA